MTKVYIYQDEVWPVYNVYTEAERFRLEADIPEDILERFWAVEGEYYNLNRVIEKYYEEAEVREWEKEKAEQEIRFKEKKAKAQKEADERRAARKRAAS